MAHLSRLNSSNWPMGRAKTLLRSAIRNGSYLSRRQQWEIQAIAQYFVLVNNHLPSKINKELMLGNNNAFNKNKFPEKFIPVVLEARRLFDLYDLNKNYRSHSGWEDDFIALSDSLKKE